mgnify:CR=1 FL=1
MATSGEGILALIEGTSLGKKTERGRGFQIKVHDSSKYFTRGGGFSKGRAGKMAA